jgi:hypothetical protein
MNVPSENGPLLRRLARWLLARAVRLWPAETREWGLAIAAELDETRGSWESLAWSLGGVLLFLRSLARNVWAWLHLPAGVSLSCPAEPAPLFPKRSRLLTLATLAGGAALLFLPFGQQALNTLRSSWSGFIPSAFDGWQLDRLGRRADKQNDAGTLAFLALSTDDPARFLKWADRAVSIDPQYMWIYASARTHGTTYASEPTKRFERLEASDLDNAAPVLLEASLLENSRVSQLYQSYSPRPGEVEAMLEKDPKWIGLMQRAFARPRYDSYLGRRARLVAAVWNREKNLSPSTVLAGLWSYPIPGLESLRVFSLTLFRQAEQSAAAGDFPEAERLVDRVSGFGQRMAAGDRTNAYPNIENLIGLRLQRDAAAELEKLYTTAGRPSDARKAASEIQRLDDRSSELRARFEARGPVHMHAFRRLGFLVQGLGIFLILAALSVLAAMVVLEIVPAGPSRRRTWLRKAASWATDYAPPALLVSSGAFLLSFLPYARVFAEYRSSSEPLPDEHLMVEALWGLGALPVRVLGSDYDIWLAVTVALSGLAVLIVARSLYRSGRVRALLRP